MVPKNPKDGPPPADSGVLDRHGLIDGTAVEAAYVPPKGFKQH